MLYTGIPLQLLMGRTRGDTDAPPVSDFGGKRRRRQRCASALRLQEDWQLTCGLPQAGRPTTAASGGWTAHRQGPRHS